MKNIKNKVMLKLRLVLALAIGIAAAAIQTFHAQSECVRSVLCTYAMDTNGSVGWYGTWCIGTQQQSLHCWEQSSDGCYWLSGGGPCGEKYINGEDTGTTCGLGIATECA
jgi:hypothetical protein